MLILTAYTNSFSAMGDLCWSSMERYRQIHPHVKIAKHLLPEPIRRNPSWEKVDLIRRHLQWNDYVTWVDADALAIGGQDIATIIKPTTLNIAKDGNGINCGIMCWKACKEAFEALERMEVGYDKHKDDPWFEQACLMEFVDELDAFYQPKDIWNVYPETEPVTENTLFVHFPGMKNEDRQKAMEGFAS